MRGLLTAFIVGQLLLWGVGAGSNVTSKSVTVDKFWEPNFDGTDANGATPTAADAGNDTHGSGCTWQTIVSGSSNPLTHITYSNTAWIQSFSFLGYLINVNGATGTPFTGASRGGIGISVDHGTSTSNFIRCSVTTGVNHQAALGFFFKTTMTGTSFGIHDFAAIRSANGEQASWQWGDKGGSNPGCGNGLGLQVEGSDSGTRHGSCVTLSSSTNYFGELYTDFTGGIITAKVYTVAAPCTVGSLVGTSATTIGTGTTLSGFEIGDDPNGSTAAGKITIESQLVMAQDANAVIPLVCTR
jgi:hypothetical protein